MSPHGLGTMTWGRETDEHEAAELLDLFVTSGGNFLDTAPFFGELQPGLHAAVGSNGVGLAKGTIAGRLLAEQALGYDSALLQDMLAYPQPNYVPPEPLLRIGATVRLGWEQFRAGREV